MLKLQASPTFHANVDITWPGEKKAQRFVAEFARLSQSELEALGDASHTDREIARIVLKGWSGVQGAEGNDLPYSDEARELALDMHPLAACVVKTFYVEIAGAKRKNS